jgi:hypothetical protein
VAPRARATSPSSVDDQLVPVRCLHWKVGGLLSPQDTVNVPSRAAELVNDIGPIGNQTATTSATRHRSPNGRKPVVQESNELAVLLQAAARTPRYQSLCVVLVALFASNADTIPPTLR